MYKSDTGALVGCSKDSEAAKKYLAALRINVEAKEGKRKKRLKQAGMA